ncbi:adhesion G-protein coupled receptor F3-like [Betta splendens]|uniref:Adhesion G-protein coupled receptor F3-like n=1 Tax=Betta splendens TaxID=158456 RepID=A0A9W2XLX7_BETSP|nr:adhesion G-protein coupled receptor F3-like [Betta splendens]
MFNECAPSFIPNFLDAASNVVNWTWNAINKSLLHDMSSTYLQSVDKLVKNINVNMSQDVSSTNLQFKSCFADKCRMSVFDVVVNLEKKTGTLKTVAVKKLMDKLNNGYNDTKPTSLLLIATVQDCSDSSLKIRLDYPDIQQTQRKPLCVFWNTTNKDWSDEGCSLSTNNKKYTCECNHLTPFSALLSKGGISKHNTALDMITNVGLAVSIFSLMIFLTTECLVWSVVVKSNLAHSRHTAMVNITTFLLLSDICMLASTSPDNIPETWCLILTICKHLFYLAMFCWMLCLSVMLVHQLIFVFSPLRKRVFMFISSIVGYALPILIVGSSYVYYGYNNIEYFDRKTCWLIYVRFLVGSMHAFLLPVGTIIFTNLFCMTVIILKFVKSSVPGCSNADDKVTAKGIVKVLAVLMPVFGVTWIIGYIGLTFPEGNVIRDVLDFSFTILNSFQVIQKQPTQ